MDHVARWTTLRRHYWGWLAAAILCVAPPANAWASDADLVFRQALVKESADRDLEGAIALYNQVTKMATAGSLLILQAQLRMADCYERLGKTGDAESAYQKILAASTGPPSEISREAQANLDRLVTQDRLTEIQMSSAPKPVSLKRAFVPTAFSVLVGPGLVFTRAESVGALSLAARYHLPQRSHFLSSYLEYGATMPLGNREVASGLYTSLKWRYQMSLAFIGELPHGSQLWVLPEIGAGFALTRANTDALSGSATGSGNLSDTNNVWSPFFSTGFLFWPNRRISFLARATYAPSPFHQNAELQNASSAPTLNVPGSSWVIALQARIKIGLVKTVTPR